MEETKAPSSHAQARDPAWANYKWNQNDILAGMLTAPAIVKDKAQPSLIVALTATYEPDHCRLDQDGGAHPRTDGTSRDRVRQDLAEGWRWMADVPVAFVKRYGDDPRMSPSIMGGVLPLR